MNVSPLNSTNTTRPRRRWFRFSLRTLMLVTTMAGMGLAPIVYYREEARRQKVAYDAIRGLVPNKSTDGNDPFYGSEVTSMRSKLGKVLLGDDSFGHIKSVFFHKGDVDDHVFVHLAQFPKLENLVISHTKITGVGLVHLRVDQLTSLRMIKSPISDAGLFEIAKQKRLTSLSIGEGMNVSGPGLGHISHLPNLEQLFLYSPRFKDDDFVHFQKFRRLRRLSIDCNQITNAGLAHLKGLPQLERLELVGEQISDASIKPLLVLKELQWLTLRETKVTGSTLDQLQELPHLTNLFLKHASISNEGMTRMAALTNVVYLSLIDCQISEEAFQRLRGFTKLRTLDLRGRKITDMELGLLQALAELEELHFDEGEVTEKGRQEFRKVVPKCTIWESADHRAYTTKIE